jgi:hypothetical protein
MYWGTFVSCDKFGDLKNNIKKNEKSRIHKKKFFTRIIK